MNASQQGIWSRHYGHYNPTQHVQPLSQGQIDQFVQLLQMPISSERQAKLTINMAAKILPAFQKVVSGLNRDDVSLIMHDDLPMPACAESADGRKTVILPRGKSLRDQAILTGFFRACGSIVQLPEGLEIPSIETAGDISTLKESLWKRYSWQTAIQLSFLYQIELELRRAGMRFSNIESPGVMEEIDWALMALFKKRGLCGIAESYINYLSPSRRDETDRNFQEKAANFVSGAISFHGSNFCSPSAQDSQPEWIKSELDEQLEFYAKFDRALYTGENINNRLSPERLNEIRKIWKKRILSGEHIDLAKGIIEELAPKLASWLFAISNEKNVNLTIVDERLPQPTIPVGFEKILYAGDEGASEILVSQGYTVGEFIPNFVNSIARFTMPYDFTEYFSFNRVMLEKRDVEGVKNLLKRQYIRNEGWGYSARFEFYHQARQRGFEIEETNEGLSRVERVLQEAGFWTFCQHFSEFSNPQLMSIMDTQLGTLADHIVESYHQNKSTTRSPHGRP